MIEIKNLKKVYGGVTVVNVPQLTIAKGESIGLVGNNGAGKTTLFRMILDLILPEAGEVLSNGEVVAGSESWKSYTASYLDEGFLIDYLTPEEYLYFIGGLHEQSQPQVDETLAQLGDFFNGEILRTGKYIRDLSKGNQCKVGVASCLLQNPQLLMLDEPFANIDPIAIQDVKNIIRHLVKKNIGILITDHNAREIFSVVDRSYLVAEGKVLLSGTVQELLASDHARHTYFGENFQL